MDVDTAVGVTVAGGMDVGVAVGVDAEDPSELRIGRIAEYQTLATLLLPLALRWARSE